MRLRSTLGDCPMESDGLVFRLRFRSSLSHELAFGRIYSDVIKTRYEIRCNESGVIELLIFSSMYCVCQHDLGMVQIHRDLTVFGSGRYTT